MAASNAQRDIRDRIGLVVAAPTSAAVVDLIVAAEAAGVRQVWMTQGAAAPDTLGIFAAAAVRTRAIRLGSAIITTYPRHPLTMAQQALTIADLAPDRLRLGIGPSHRPTIEVVYGLPMPAPLDHLTEYVTVVRQLLWEGRSTHAGEHYQVRATLPRTPRTPILISALRLGAFALAGAISDGALSWLCPVPYLLRDALPALHRGAEEAGRPAPPLVAHISVALHDDRAAALAAARTAITRYAGLPYYARMFADAGFPVADGKPSDALIESLVVSGDEAHVANRLRDLLAQGLDELLVMPIPVRDEGTERASIARLIGSL